MNRREFFKGLTAAAGTVAVASSAVAALDVANVSIKNDIVDYGYSDAGNGWYRVWKSWKGDYNQMLKDGFTLDFGEGLQLTPHSMAQLEQSGPERMSFSCYVKANPETVLDSVEIIGETL